MKQKIFERTDEFIASFWYQYTTNERSKWLQYFAFLAILTVNTPCQRPASLLKSKTFVSVSAKSKGKKKSNLKSVFIKILKNYKYFLKQLWNFKPLLPITNRLLKLQVLCFTFCNHLWIMITRLEYYKVFKTLIPYNTPFLGCL